MRPSDLPEVLAIEQASFKSPWSQASFEAEMQKSFADLKVARLATEDGVGPVVGYGCCWLVADEIQITNLAVHNDYRRRGVGRRLMVHILQQGYNAGARLALLEVRGSNQAARALYEGLGFVTVQERPNYYSEHRERGLVLELKLDPGSGGNDGT
jgi:ribosomal-protein-alanine N-acetyltransferase